MKQKNISSRLYGLGRAILAATVVPVFMIYVLVAKPDFHIANAAAHIVVPVAQAIGGVITWPIRAVAGGALNFRELANARRENIYLRARLDDAMAMQREFEIAILENQRLRAAVDAGNMFPHTTIKANITKDNAAIGNHTFFIDRGARHGVGQGMVVITMDGALVGIVIDAGRGFARVRALTDSDSNIPVRIAGTSVYGFLTGNGTARPTIGFLSDPGFQITPGLRLVSSNIRGVLPDGLFVGAMETTVDANVGNPVRSAHVLVLGFDADGRYE